MANTKLKLKKSSVSGRAPVAGDLDYGELAINYTDGKLYYRNSSNAVKAFNDSASTHTLITAFVDSDYVQARSAGTVGASNTIVLDNFTGDSSTTVFGLSATPAAEHHSFITINGIAQQTDAYSITGNSLTLSEAPVNNDDIEVRTVKIQTASVELTDHATYVYQPSSSTTVFSGSDINSNTLSYVVGKLDVFFNGSRLVNGLDYTATNGTSITLLGDAAVSGDTISINSFGAAHIIDDVNASSLTTTSTNQAIDSFSKLSYRTAKYIVQLTQNSRYHSQEVLLIHDGSTVSMVEYADLFTDSDLGTLDADISGNNVRLLVSPNYTNTNVRVKRVSLGV